jgi:hypothetical protein
MIMYVNQSFSTIADNSDRIFFSLLVETLKLFSLCQPFRDLTPMTIRIATLRDGHTFDPSYRGIVIRASCAKVLKEAKSKRYHGANRQQNLWWATIRFESPDECKSI